MLCPKCQMEQEDRNLLCDYCGIVFAKYGALRERALVESRFTVHAPSATVAARWLRGRFFTPQPVTNPLALGGRVALLLVLAVWGWRIISQTIESNGAGGSFLHLVNLPFHEAGHVFFTPFGDFVRSLGGTLGQMIMPMACCLVLLLKTRDPFGAGAALWWFGENFIDLAPYINDAGTGELPLLGGNTGESSPYGFHDWEYLLTETNRLGRDHAMARTSHSIGTFVMVLALAWMAAMLWRSYRQGQAGRD